MEVQSGGRDIFYSNAWAQFNIFGHLERNFSKLVVK